MLLGLTPAGVEEADRLRAQSETLLGALSVLSPDDFRAWAQEQRR